MGIHSPSPPIRTTRQFPSVAPPARGSATQCNRRARGIGHRRNAVLDPRPTGQTRRSPAGSLRSDAAAVRSLACRPSRPARADAPAFICPRPCRRHHRFGCRLRCCTTARAAPPVPPPFAARSPSTTDPVRTPIPRARAHHCRVPPVPAGSAVNVERRAPNVEPRTPNVEPRRLIAER